MSKLRAETKICSGCKRELPNTERFYNNNKMSKDGLECKCKSCAKAVKAKRYKNVIYEINCVETNKYYIGQTIKPINDRISKHFSDAKRGRKQELYQDMRKYSRDKFTYKEIEHVEDALNLDLREQYWIKEYRGHNKNLYNIELGGRKHIVVPEETRVRQARSKGTKPFYVYTANKKFVGEYKTIQDAQRELNISGLGLVLKSKASHSGGYVAIFKEDFAEHILDDMISKLDIKNGKVRTKVDVSGENNGMFGRASATRVPIVQLSIDGKFIRMFNCYSDIETYDPNFCRSSIAYHIKHGTASYKGYRWEELHNYQDKLDKAEPSYE